MRTCYGSEIIFRQFQQGKRNVDVAVSIVAGVRVRITANGKLTTAIPHNAVHPHQLSVIDFLQLALEMTWVDLHRDPLLGGGGKTGLELIVCDQPYQFAV